MKKDYPDYVEVDSSRCRRKDLGREIGQVARRNRKHSLLSDSLRETGRTGWFRLPFDARRARGVGRLLGGSGSSLKLFDYIAAGGARWLGGHAAPQPYSAARKCVLLLAWVLLVAWWLFRFIPPP